VSGLVAVVLNWNGGEDTLRALQSLRDAGAAGTIVVDNGSSDGSDLEVERRFPDVELIRTGANLGFAGGNNVGLRRALDRGADWLLLLNNDARADSGLPAALEEAARARPDAGVLACKVYFEEPPDVLMYAGGEVNLRLGYGGRQTGWGERDTGQHDQLRDVGRATGAGMAVSRQAAERAGLLDEELFAYVEDVEWCVRIREAGFAVVFVPEAKVWHRGSASTGGTASTTNLYYDTRNTLAVAERHAPLRPGLRALRRGVVVGSHVLRALQNPKRGAAVRAVLSGWRDYRQGKMGPRDGT
jgi:GT2 family glycosyltransferase